MSQGGQDVSGENVFLNVVAAQGYKLADQLGPERLLIFYSQSYSSVFIERGCNGTSG
jgi:hypothetical protein